MLISASRLAALIAARIGPIAPHPFEVRAAGSDLHIDHPDGWGSLMPLDWIEDADEERDAAELAELIVGTALNSLQDAVSEATTEPWPPLSASGAPRDMAPYQTRCDGAAVYFWYGQSEQSRVMTFEPIALSDVVHQP